MDWTFSDFHRTEVKKAHTEITASQALQKQYHNPQPNNVLICSCKYNICYTALWNCGEII